MGLEVEADPVENEEFGTAGGLQTTTDGEHADEADASAHEAVGDGEGAESGEDGDLLITLGDEQAPAEEEDQAKAPAWVRDLRKANREKDRKIRELEQRIAAAAPARAAVVVGVKPTLESCQYDESKFEGELTAWHDRKRQVEDQQRQAEETGRRQNEAWQATVNAYNTAKSALKVADFDDAEAAVTETFSVVQQGIILQGIRDADTKAKLVYALGKSPKKAKELAAINDPVQFAVAIGEVKTMLKTVPRKTPPVPERQVRGAAPGAASVDSTLERLRADAAKNGDYSKVHAYKLQQRAKQRV